MNYSDITPYIRDRMEEIQNAGKIIRPAYTSVKQESEYLPLTER